MLDPDQMATLLHRYAFDPNQPRDEEGRWTEVGGFHVHVDKGDIIRKGGHIGLHGKHISEVPGFLQQLMGGGQAAAPAAAAQPVQKAPAQAAASPEETQQASAAIKSIVDNVGPGMSYPKIAGVIDGMKSLSPEAIKSAAAAQGMTLQGRSKKQLLDHLHRRLRDRQGSWERVQFRPDDPGDKPSGGSAMHDQFAAMHPDDLAYDLQHQHEHQRHSGVEATMHEFKHGTLKSGSGHPVESRAQAIAIGLHEEREEGKKG